MAISREAKEFLFSDKMIDITNLLLKRYEPTDLSKSDILSLIYPPALELYNNCNDEINFKRRLISATDRIVRSKIFPYYNKSNSNISSDTLYARWKNGDTKAYDLLIEKNMHLPSSVLISLGYNDPFSQELFQEGMLAIIKYLHNRNESAKIKLCIAFNIVLHNFFKAFINRQHYDQKYIDESPIKERDFPIIYREYDEYFSSKAFDDMYADKDFLLLIKKNIFISPYFSTIEKTTIIAYFGFINNVKLSYARLGKYFNRTRSRVQQISTQAICKLIRYGKSFSNINESSYTLFDYLNLSKQYAFEYINTLNEDEINSLKSVWGNDFTKLIDINKCYLIPEQVDLYFKTIGKIYDYFSTIIEESMIV